MDERSDRQDGKNRRPESESHVGRICPYCRFAITATDQVTVCSLCQTPHHSSCWYENGRCTTYGCRGVADRLEALLPPEYRSRYNLPGLGRPTEGAPASPVKWTVAALIILSPAMLLSVVLFRYAWLLVAAVVVAVTLSAFIHEHLDEPADAPRRDMLLVVVLLLLSVVAVAFIMLTVMYAPT